MLNILCKVSGNGLHHTRLLDDDQPGLGWHCHRPVLKTTYPGHSCSRWTYWASPELGLNTAYTDCDNTLWHTSKLILLESVKLTFTRYHILTSLQRIFNTHLKKLSLVVFCFNFWTLQQKPCDYICSGSKNVRFLLGHPVQSIVVNYLCVCNVARSDTTRCSSTVSEHTRVHWPTVGPLCQWLNCCQ